MTFTLRLAAPIAAAVLFPTSSALADVTPADLWSDWQAAVTEAGGTLTAGSDRTDGGVRTLGEVTLRFAQDDGAMVAVVPEITLTPEGGDVRVGLAPAYTLEISGTADGEAGRAEIDVTHDGLDLVASGVPGDILYTYASPEIRMGSDRIEAQGEVVPMRFDMRLVDIAGTSRSRAGTPRETEGSFEAAAMAVSVAGDDPDGAGQFALDFSLADFSGMSSGTMPPLAAMGPGSTLPEGFAATGQVRHGAMTSRLSATDADGAFDLAAMTESGGYDFDISAERGLTYAGTSIGTNVMVTLPDLPIGPLGFSIAESGGRLSLPVAPGDAPAPFALEIRLIGLEIAEQIWAMFDPMANLPRDPAELVIALSGTGRWLVDLSDPEAVEAMGEGPPAEVSQLTLDRLALSAAGVDLTGQGGVTFEAPADGTEIPVAEGQVAFTLAGIDTLFDRLIAMGLLPPEQAMGARMMLGLFARPGTAPGTYESVIEFTPDGAVTANGQRIR